MMSQMNPKIQHSASAILISEKIGQIGQKRTQLQEKKKKSDKKTKEDVVESFCISAIILNWVVFSAFFLFSFFSFSPFSVTLPPEKLMAGLGDLFCESSSSPSSSSLSSPPSSSPPPLLLSPPSPLELCGKCKKEPKILDNRNGVPICWPCFRQNFIYRFDLSLTNHIRPTDGSTRRLICAFSGQTCSRLMLHLLMNHILTRRQKQYFEVEVVYVDFSQILGLEKETEERTQNLLKSIVSSYGGITELNVLSVNDDDVDGDGQIQKGEERLKGDDLSVGDVGKKEIEPKPTTTTTTTTTHHFQKNLLSNEIFRALVAIVKKQKDLDSRQEALDHLLRWTLLQRAQEKESDCILMGHCANTLASQTMISLASGRGVALPNDAGLVTNYNVGNKNISIVRLMRDDLLPECQTFVEKENLSTVLLPDTSSSSSSSQQQQLSSSIFGITNSFISQLQTEQRHTCHSMLRCVDKMVASPTIKSESQDEFGEEPSKIERDLPKEEEESGGGGGDGENLERKTKKQQLERLSLCELCLVAPPVEKTKKQNFCLSCHRILQEEGF